MFTEFVKYIPLHTSTDSDDSIVEICHLVPVQKSKQEYCLSSDPEDSERTAAKKKKRKRLSLRRKSKGAKGRKRSKLAEVVVMN